MSPTGHVTTQYGAEKMRLACRVTKARIMFNITGFPQLQPSHDRTAMLRYTHTVSCTEMSAMILTPCCLLSPLCASRAVVTTATVVIVHMQTADRARSEMAGVQDVGWDKEGTVRREDYNFFYAKRKRKSSIANRIFCTQHRAVSS